MKERERKGERRKGREGEREKGRGTEREAGRLGGEQVELGLHPVPAPRSDEVVSKVSILVSACKGLTKEGCHSGI